MIAAQAPGKGRRIYMLFVPFPGRHHISTSPTWSVVPFTITQYKVSKTFSMVKNPWGTD